MGTIKKASTSTEPNDARTEEHEASPLPASVRISSSYMPSYIPEGIFDRIRAEARTAKYDNTVQERETIAAVDQAIFDRVRPLEMLAIDRAKALIEDTEPGQRNANGQPVGNPVQVIEGHLAELDAIRFALREGKASTAELAERYKKVQRAVQHGDGHAIVARAREAKSLSGRLSDPLGHVQKVLHKMPLGNWRPLGIRNW
ncbi:hypothetical protein M3667_14215 [Microbacterium sp. P26]|uniref:hypothetical protein n=1 Tax=Microbacterium TaxID=33882 RepID=UPI00203E757E|nr:hypothetical protein [Microbacterium sp. P26]MCM3503023.1 hypothetical protein [Microbacterium sp. P26]